MKPVVLSADLRYVLKQMKLSLLRVVERHTSHGAFADAVVAECVGRT